MTQIKGVMAVVPSPLNEDESSDIDSVERITDFLVGHNISMFALGSAGEGMNLTEDVRVATARRMAEVNDGRTPLLIGGGTFSVKAALNYIDQVADTKIDGIHVIPYDGKVSGQAVEELYVAIADRSPLPIWLYQNTTRTSGISIETVQRLRDHPNIAGCKVAGFDHRLNQTFLALERDDFQMVGAADSQFFSFMCLGTACSSTSTAACFPELLTELYDTIQADKLSEAREKNRAVMTFLKRIPKGAYRHNGESTAELKYLLSLRGICQDVCARPFRSLNAEEKAAADLVYADYQHYLETGDLRY